MKPQRSIITITDGPKGGIEVSCTYSPSFKRGKSTPGIGLSIMFMEALGATAVLGNALTTFANAKPKKRKR